MIRPKSKVHLEFYCWPVVYALVQVSRSGSKRKYLRASDIGRQAIRLEAKQPHRNAMTAVELRKPSAASSIRSKSSRISAYNPGGRSRLVSSIQTILNRRKKRPTLKSEACWFCALPGQTLGLSTVRAYQFPFDASFNPSMSKACSATIFFNRAFSC